MYNIPIFVYLFIDVIYHVLKSSSCWNGAFVCGLCCRVCIGNIFEAQDIKV